MKRDYPRSTVDSRHIEIAFIDALRFRSKLRNFHYRTKQSEQ